MTATTTLDRAGLDRMVAKLRAGAARWSQLPTAAKRDLLTQLHHGVADAAGEWVEVCCRLKESRSTRGSRARSG